ncbi:hypothetical protein [Tahibacter amnicola]|uniref:Uncharacterized protein n=1 Tax=Tahibacter amnicola TaxID=2976241 RepID=A0ABY6BCD8_9GAMM|nr:hypothetical protein [Tahibacter amnicola]UXI66785.1 hypothetical protein N4264_18800 [Tahibacter amnicola]
MPATLASARGGTVSLLWNRELMAELGVRAISTRPVRVADAQGFVALDLADGGNLRFTVVRRQVSGFLDGELRFQGSLVLALPDTQLVLSNIVIRPRAASAPSLMLVDADGIVWFYVDNLMQGLTDAGRRLRASTMDVRISDALARRLGRPFVAGWSVADARLDVAVEGVDASDWAVPAGEPKWPGTPAPGGNVYQADVFMTAVLGQYRQCHGLCDGPDGENDGTVVVTPSSSLRNNVNDGAFLPTVSGDPDGTSQALYAADIPWYAEFSGSFAPYDNDQHPLLIWNLYRVDAAGRIDQIGRSGTKHAFFTVNSGCLEGGTDNHILNRGCNDTYSVSNNDYPYALSPRSEIVPAQVLWGRCGATDDPDCDNVNNAPSNPSPAYRLTVRESQCSGAATAGALFFLESWYLVRDDVDVENTMGSTPVFFQWNPPGPWSVVNGSNYRLGPAINRWVDPSAAGPNLRNVAIATAEGRSRIAAKVTSLGGGQWRYDYAVMNLDFARAVTTGTPGHVDDADPAMRLRVVHNFGYDAFAVSLPAGVVPTAISFSDGDTDPANDWTSTAASFEVRWSAPANPSPPPMTPPVSHSLDWGVLFRFSFIANTGPADTGVGLHIAQAGTPVAHSAVVPGPAPGVPDALFADDFE